ncbi:unnamed protein product, partial [Oppiella nova]
MSAKHVTIVSALVTVAVIIVLAMDWAEAVAKKKEQTLGERVQQLTDLSLKRPTI